MTRRYATPMSDLDADQLQEAAADVAYLTSQGESPTHAIAKVAAAARFSKQKTNLLTYAYSNGVAAEKRGSTGGPFERLGEFPLPDPQEIHRLVYGQPKKMADGLPDELWPDFPDQTAPIKVASVPTNFLPRGMATFDVDPTKMDHEDVRTLFGMESKTASDADCDIEERPAGHGFSVSHTSVSIGLSPLLKDKDDNDADTPQSLHDFLKKRIGHLGLPDDFETAILKILGEKKEAMIQANAEADDAFVRAQSSLDTLGQQLKARHLEPRFKRAGLLSIHAYYPQVAALLDPYLDEVNGYLIKNASHDLLDVTAKHPWVTEAGTLQKDLETVASLTITANRKSAEYEAACRLYTHRDAFRKSADWSSFLAGSLMPGIGDTAKGLLGGRDQSGEKAAIRRELLDDLDDRLHDLSLQDIGVQSMMSDFGTNDEILSAYGKKRLLHGYNDLIRTAPGTMRNPALARSMLQQYMTQGRMAPTEYMSALQMNKLDPRKDTIAKDKEKKKESDE
jgi:uncharacterized protein YoaH (UPF0181 family)